MDINRFNLLENENYQVSVKIETIAEMNSNSIDDQYETFLSMRKDVKILAVTGQGGYYRPSGIA